MAERGHRTHPILWRVDELCIALLLHFLIKHAIIIMLKGRGSAMKREREGLVWREDSKFMSACVAETPGQPTHQAFPVTISRWTSISCALHFLAISLCSRQWIFGFHRHCLRTEAAWVQSHACGCFFNYMQIYVPEVDFHQNIRFLMAVTILKTLACIYFRIYFKFILYIEIIYFMKSTTSLYIFFMLWWSKQKATTK